MDDPLQVDPLRVPHRFLRPRAVARWPGHTRGGARTFTTAKVWQPLDCLTMSGNADGEKFSSVGLLGGTGGTKTKLEIVSKGQAETLPHLRYLPTSSRETSLFPTRAAAAVWVILSTGRSKKCSLDAMNEYISIKTAQDIYGVVVDPETFAVDEAATEALRAKLKAEKSAGK